MKTFSLDADIEEKLRRIPSRQSFLVNSLLRFFFEECERKGIDWQKEIFVNPEKTIEKVFKKDLLQSKGNTVYTEKSRRDIDVESFW